jgi:hypothetical protein
MYGKFFLSLTNQEPAFLKLILLLRRPEKMKLTLSFKKVNFLSNYPVLVVFRKKFPFKKVKRF